MPPKALVAADPLTGRIVLRAPYHPTLVQAARSVPGYRWHADTKTWSWPDTAAPQVVHAFSGLATFEDAVIRLADKLASGKKLAERFVAGDVPDITFPVRAHLYAHQRRMAGMALSMPAFAFFAEMRTGKTLAAIAAAGRAYLDGRIEKMLVVCPSSVMGVWRREFERWAAFPYQIRVLDQPSTREREQILAYPWREGLRVVVANYESTWRMESSLANFASGGLVVIDESHRIKDARTHQAKAVHLFGELASWRLALTGTPITQSPLDAFSQFLFLDPSVFGRSFVRFRNRYAVMKNGRVVSWQNLDEFTKKAYSIAFRITRAECFDVPNEIEEIIDVKLSPRTRDQYETIRRDSVLLLSAGKVTATNVLTQLLRLQQIAGGFVTTDSGETVQVGSEKIDAALDLLEDLLEDQSRKVVVFTRFLAEIRAFSRALAEQRIPAATLTGETPVRDRESIVRAFQDDDKPRVLVAQVATGGLGIDLSRADTEIFLSLDWSLSTMQQARARILGGGQRARHVNYYYIVAQKTVDQRIMKALTTKEDLAEKIVDNWMSLIGEGVTDEPSDTRVRTS